MRRVLLLGLPALALLAAAGGAYMMFHHGDLLAEARSRIEQGDMHAAEIDLDTYLRSHPGNPEASYHLGTIKLAENNLVAAERLLRQARAGGYNPAAIVMPLGETYLQQHKFDELLADFPAASAPAGAESDTLSLRATAYLALHQAQQAQQSADAAVAAAPGKPAPVVVAARIEAAMNNSKAAESRIDALLAKDPKMPEAVLLKIDLMLRRNDAAGALAIAEKLLADNPTSPAAKMATARALTALGRDLDAMKLVNDVVHHLPHDIGANFLKLRLADRQRDFPAADAALNVLLPVIDELPQGEYFAGVTKLGVNQPAQAQEAAAKYVAQNPGDPEGLKLLAFAELTLSRGDRVEAVLAPLMQTGHPDGDTLDLVARARAMRGDLKGAEAELAQAAALQPGNSDILNRLGAARVELGDTVAGEADLRRSLTQTPDQPRAATALVQSSLAAGDVKGAASVVAQLRKAMGDSETVGVLDGQVKIAALDLTGAEAVYTDVLKRFPDSRPATLGLVQVEGRLGHAKTARDRLAGWMATHPTDKIGLKLLVTGDMAGRNTPAAIAATEAAHGADPSDIDIDLALAELYLANKTPEKAFDLIARSTAAGTTVNPALLPLKGQALIAMGRLAEAQDVLTDAIATTPADPRPRFGLIELKMRQKDYVGARQVAQDALAVRPGDPRLMEALVATEYKAGGIHAALATAATLKEDPRNMPAALLLPGTVLAASGDKAGAATAYLAAFHEAPSELLALTAAGALDRAGKTADAAALLTQWTALHPDSAAAQRVLAAMALGAHHYQDADARLARVLTAHPSDAAALNNMAWVKLAGGHADDALSYAQRAYYLSPGAETEDTLGWVMASKGDTAAALPLLEQAAAMKPSPPILYHYAVALNGQSRTQDAREALDKALAETTPWDERQAAEKLHAQLK